MIIFALQVVQQEVSILNIVAESVNEYCSDNPVQCCSLVGATAR